jgi:flagellin
MALTMNVNNNISAINTHRHMGANNRDLGTRLERLSSGMRINNADDDAAGLSISEGFRAQISGLTMGVRNAEMGSNLVQVAEGSLGEVSSMLIRMRELAVQSSTSTMNDRNRESIEAEVNQLKQEIDRIAQSTVYNDQTLLTGTGNRPDLASSTAYTDAATTGVMDITSSGTPEGTYTIEDNGDGTISVDNGTVGQTIRFATLLDGDQLGNGTTAVLNFDRLGLQVKLAGPGVADAEGAYTLGSLDGKTIEIAGVEPGWSFQVGADDVSQDRIELSIDDMTSSGSYLNLNSVSLGTMASARESIAKLDLAIDRVAQTRGDLGSVLNRLEYTINFTDNSIENNTNSEATLRDADMAVEVSRLTRVQVLSQAANAMLAQANSTPQSALSLLQ